jgi:glycosyltransferase involved in cell wall biosynthesis
MKICILLPYANPHTTGWLDEFIKISDHVVIIGIVHSVRKYRSNHFQEVDNKTGYLYFFRDYKSQKIFYSHLRQCNYLITLGMFEPWFFKAVFFIPRPAVIYVLSEPFRPGNRRKLLIRKIYIQIIKLVKPSSVFTFLCMGGTRVKDQYQSYGFKNSRYYQFGHFPVLSLNPKAQELQITVIKFIFVGKLIPRKGIDILISVLNHLKQKYLNWEFLIVGDGELKSEIIKIGEEDRRIQYIENISDADILKSKFNDSHILFLPSYFDGWGAVVNEALSSCCSLLLSEKVYAGVPLLLNGENGFNFDPFNLSDLYVILHKYFCNPGILKNHFKKSGEIYLEWNYRNAAASFNNLLSGIDNSENTKLLKEV